MQEAEGVPGRAVLPQEPEVAPGAPVRPRLGRVERRRAAPHLGLTLLPKTVAVVAGLGDNPNAVPRGSPHSSRCWRYAGAAPTATS